MKKLIIVGLSCLILGSCTLPMQKDTVSVSNEGTPGVNTQIKDSYKGSIETASEKIKNTPDFNNCMQTSVNMCVQSVGMQLAQKSKDTTLCDELPNADQKESCKFGIVMADAVEKQNPELCKSLSGNYAKRCSIEIYRNQAVKNKDISTCKKIAEIEKQENTASGAPMMQGVMGSVDQCIFTIIMSNGESTNKDCDSLENESMQEMCKTSIKNRPKMIQ